MLGRLGMSEAASVWCRRGKRVTCLQPAAAGRALAKAVE